MNWKRVIAAVIGALVPTSIIISMNLDFNNWPAFGWVLMFWGGFGFAALGYTCPFIDD